MIRQRLHGLSHPLITEEDTHEFADGGGRRYTIRAQLDDRIIKGTHVVSRHSLVETTLLPPDHERWIRRRLQELFLRELGRELGFEDD